MNTTPEATNIKAENKDATQYAATINGKNWCGITDGSRLWPSVQAAIDAGAEVAPYVEPEVSYADKRRQEYPPIGDQLDAIIKELNYRRMNGEDLISEMDSIVNDCLAVKAKYPKPEA